MVRDSESLVCCDTGYQEDFVQLCHSKLSMLECMYVMQGLKRTCMTILAEDKIGLLEAYCNTHGLFLALSDDKMAPVQEKAKGGFSNRFSWVPRERPGGDFAAFLAKEQRDATLAKYYYARGDNVKLGALFGYPRCCVRFFLEHARSSRTNDYILDAIKDTRQYDFFNNRALRYFDISLISHFPCSLDCKASQAIASERLSCMRQECPDMATRFESQLKSVVIYTEQQGVFYANDYSVDGNRVRYTNLRGTIRNSLFHKLDSMGQIEIISHDCLLVGTEKLSGEIGIMLFK